MTLYQLVSIVLVAAFGFAVSVVVFVQLTLVASILRHPRRRRR